MNRLIVKLLSFYFFLSCMAFLLLFFSEWTILPFFGMLIVLLWMSYFCVAKKKIKLTKMDIYLGIFLISFMISLWFSSDFLRDDWIALGTNIELACILVVSRTMLIDQRRIRFALGMLLGGLGLMAIITVLQDFHFISLGIGDMEMSGITRYESPAGGINRSSFYFGVAMLLACGLLFEVKSLLTRILLFWVIVVSALANLLTYSVSGLLALVAGFFILFSNRIFKEKFLSKRNALVFFGLLFLIILAAYNPRMQEKYEQIEYMPFIYWGSARGAAYLGAIESISSHPLLGVGPTPLVEKIAEYYPFNRQEEWAAHNTLLSIAGETGLIGLFFFILFYLNVAVPSWRYYSIHRSHLSQVLVSCLVMLLIMSFTMDLQRDKLFWVILGLNAAALNLSPQAEEVVMRRF